MLTAENVAAVRLLWHKHMGRVLDIERRAHTSTDPDFGVPLTGRAAWGLADFVDFLGGEGARGYGIWDAADVLVGHLVTTPGRRCYWVDRLVVDPDYRRMCFATLALYHVLEKCKKSRRRKCLRALVPLDNREGLAFALAFARQNHLTARTALADRDSDLVCVTIYPPAAPRGR